MNVFLKILGLIGLINCIVLYGAEHKKGGSVSARADSIAARFDALEAGNYPATATDVGTGFYDPSAGAHHEANKERRSSLEGLMQQHLFAGEYADRPRKTIPQPPFEKLISRFQDKSTRAFTRRFLSNMTPEVREQLNAVAPTSPVHGTRTLSGQADNGDKQANKVDKQTALVEALMKGIQHELAQKERIHQEETALLQTLHKKNSDQADRLGKTASDNSRCAILTSGILGGASLALSIAAFAFTHKS